MGESATLLRGVFKDGKVIPDGPPLPDGTVVEFHALPVPFPAELQAEIDAWDRASDEEWANIDWGEGGLARDSG
jgi:hypothetical protein